MGGYFVHFSILGKFRWVFILFKNPEQNAGGFLLSSDFGRPNLRLGHIFGAPKFAVSPLEIPFLGPQNPKSFSRASRAGFYFVQKFPRASRGLLFCLFFPPGFRVGSYFVQFSFPKNPPGFLLKGGGLFRGPWYRYKDSLVGTKF